MYHKIRACFLSRRERLREWYFMGKKRMPVRKRSKRVTVRYSRKLFEMPPRLIILGNRILYFFTLLLLILSITRLVLHIGFQWEAVPLNYLFWGVVAVTSVLLLVFRLPLLSVMLFALAVLLHDPDRFLSVQQTYKAVCDICNQYAKSTILKEIFVSMGFINFSLSYVISARDKRFYRVPLGDVLQEQFPEHGHVFICYTCLILIGLYSCGMSYHIIAFSCLCGAISSLAYTGFMALLFTFGQASKQKMVEYYLVGSRVPHPWEDQQVEEYTTVSRLLLASDYISAYYKANGFVPQVVAGRLWKRLLDVQEQLASVAKKEARSGSGDGPSERLDDIVTYTQLVTCAASAWRHILWDLPSEQQNELICLVLQACPGDGSARFLEDCQKFLGRREFSGDMSVPLRSAVPLCGLISYLRSRDTMGDPAQYWQDCKACLQTVYQIRLLYSRAAARFGWAGDVDTAPRMLFLLLETALLTEISALEKADIEQSGGFWDRLEEMEHSFGQTFTSCAQFSEWGLGIVCSYKVDWFRSHRGMLSAYLTYQRLFGLIQPA